MFTIESENVLKNLLAVRYDPKVIQLLLWIEFKWGNVKITSGWRQKEVYKGDSGIHMTQPCRAIDIASEHYPNPEGISSRVNRSWEYDFKRPEKECLAYHDVGYGLHFHLQVHKNTRLRDNET